MSDHDAEPGASKCSVCRRWCVGPLHLDEYLKQMLGDGWTLPRLANRTGLSIPTLERYAVGMPPRAPSRTVDNSERDTNIVADIEAGESAAEVARIYGISRERVRQIWARATGKTYTRPPTPPKLGTCPVCGLYRGAWFKHTETVGHPHVRAPYLLLVLDMVKEYEGGMTTTQIAMKHHAWVTRVNSWLKAAGVTMRAPGARGRLGKPIALTHEETDEIRDHLATGATASKVARDTGHAVLTVQRIRGEMT